MLGEIISIEENLVTINLKNNVIDFHNFLNHYVLFSGKKQIVGEIILIKNKDIIINLLGELNNKDFSYGITTKPDLKDNVNLLDKSFIPFIISYPDIEDRSLYLGYSPIYENIKIHMDLNNFFSSHFAILGGTGSGKSYSMARIIQNIFLKHNFIPYKANLLVFDTYGEYQKSFTAIENNPYILVKNYTTNLEGYGEILKIPPFLLDVDDLAILLGATNPNQLQILERALYLVKIFKQEENSVLKIKNDIIARAILDILLSGRPSVQIRDQIFSVLAYYKTSELNLDTIIYQPGYNRALKHCLLIDNDGKLREIELLTDFFTKYLLETKNENIINNNVLYNLKDLEDAIDFALINEGIFKSEKVYDTNNLLKVRIHNLVNSPYNVYFNYSHYTTKEDFINELLIKNNKKAQVINFNINEVDDRMAKNMVKIISKMVFNVVENLKPRATLPFHLILEEAHRYVQNDNDTSLLGYNIFERISKEGRKYGILLGLVSQRPSELSETVISQCNNFLVFKMTHPKDMEYISKLIPFITKELTERLQIISPGYCYSFGPAFKLPTMIKMEKPNPTPESDNVNISNTWFVSPR